MRSSPAPETPAPHLIHNWQGLHGSGGSLMAARLAASTEHLVVYVATDTEAAFHAMSEIRFFASEAVPVLTFPDWETLPYDHFSAHQDIVSERLEALYELPGTKRGVLVVPVTTLLQRLAPPSFVQSQSLVVAVGETFDTATERQRLASAGYRAVDTVTERGEFAVRGSLVDIFPMGGTNPVRIDLFDDEIDSLRLFDADSQRTVSETQRVRVLPAREMPIDAAGIARFRAAWHRTFDVDVRRCHVYQDVSSGLAPQGVEYYLPLFHEDTATLFDYLPDDTVFVLDADIDAAAKRHLAEVAARFESLRHDVERPILPPDALYMRARDLDARIKRYGRARIDPGAARRRHRVNFAGSPLPELAANHRAQDPAARLRSFVGNAGARILLTAETPGRKVHLEEFLGRARVATADAAAFASFVEADTKLGIAIAPIERGFWLPDLAVVTETEIFGHRTDKAVAERTRRRGIDPDLVIKNLIELNIGSPVVHIDHGVGRYRGLETLTIDGHPMEFLTLEYAEEAKLYVPVTALHLVSRYAGADEEHAPLHRLGSDQWAKAKRKAAERARDAAAELLDIYARREASMSFAFGKPDDDYRRFVEQFEFEPTPDQDAAIDTVIEDLTGAKATDRLICGDVGFGKTEVAMRAAYLAVASGRQVAVLAPTTLLAQQHFETFGDRFADWPVSIEVVSRLRADGEVNAVAERLATGQVDIVIGTHRLLGKAFAFKNLGLVVIDEEHRFGVRQKEQLKNLRAEVDVLALTATPIPRTLNLSLSGIRDLSIIATPPARRLSIKTFVMQKRRSVIAEAIARELARGGQVFFVHNEVRTIERAADEVAELAPQARIGIGHGQMAKRKLGDVMADFYHRRINVLVCTTIIENGIDIPNANTMVIERADKFGLAQLHQLRGRVGRSHRQAYAYLMTPHPKAMTADAAKRLDAVQAAGELGIGFTLATHDLEIRGAGELLGEEQSGQIANIGFSLYMEMLERAVAAIKAGKTPNLDAPLPTSHDVNLHVPALIPDDYLPDVHARLIMYKRVANAAEQAELDELKIEMIDRFGLLPDPVRNLFRTTTIKLDASRLGIDRIDVGPAGGRIEFTAETVVAPITIVRLVQREPDTFRYRDGDGRAGNRLLVRRGMAHPDTRFQFIEALLKELHGDTATDRRESLELASR
ncbi:MAG: transcription-repair coupling factor [Gammaproteobacteria bacterium]|nr:transcription-repair coupling factor [Gammaproteobacteria bacterium]